MVMDLLHCALIIKNSKQRAELSNGTFEPDSEMNKPTFCQKSESESRRIKSGNAEKINLKTFKVKLL